MFRVLIFCSLCCYYLHIHYIHVKFIVLVRGFFIHFFGMPTAGAELPLLEGVGAESDRSSFARSPDGTVVVEGAVVE